MVNETPKLTSPELRKLRRLLIGLLVVNFLNYVAILISSWRTDIGTPIFSIPIIAGYYILEGSLFFGCQEYNWPCTFIFRIIWILHDFAYFITFALFAAIDTDTYKVLDHEKPWDEYCKYILDKDVNSQCSDYGSPEEYCKVYQWDKWCLDYCIEQPSDHACYTFAFNVALTFFFLLSFGLEIGIIVTFSKFPHLGCCHQTIVQNFVVSGQTYPMQLTQQMPNGQLVVVQNPNSEIYNPVAAQTVQNTTQTQSTIVQQVANQPAVVQPVQQQNDLPPSYDKILER